MYQLEMWSLFPRKGTLHIHEDNYTGTFWTKNSSPKVMKRENDLGIYFKISAGYFNGKFASVGNGLTT
jgi:hypothetical protein